MLIRLNQVEVSGITLRETVLSVQLEFSTFQQINTTVGVVTEQVGSGLEDPDEFLARMVQSKLGFVVLSSDRFTTSELELFNKILMLNLRELATFIGIEINVVNVQGSISQRGSRSRESFSGSRASRVLEETVGQRLEGDVEFNFMIVNTLPFGRD